MNTLLQHSGPFPGNLHVWKAEAGALFNKAFKCCDAVPSSCWLEVRHNIYIILHNSAKWRTFCSCCQGPVRVRHVSCQLSDHRTWRGRGETRNDTTKRHRRAASHPQLRIDLLSLAAAPLIMGFTSMFSKYLAKMGISKPKEPAASTSLEAPSQVSDATLRQSPTNETEARVIEEMITYTGGPSKQSHSKLH